MSWAPACGVSRQYAPRLKSRGATASWGCHFRANSGSSPKDSPCLLAAHATAVGLPAAGERRERTAAFVAPAVAQRLRGGGGAFFLRRLRCPRRCLVLVRVVVDERLGEVPVKKRIKEREKKNQNIMAKTSCRYLHVWHLPHQRPLKSCGWACFVVQSRRRCSSF